MTATNTTNADWTALQQAEDMAYFKVDLRCHLPESYSLEEKREICNEIISTSLHVDHLFLPPSVRPALGRPSPIKNLVKKYALRNA